MHGPAKKAQYGIGVLKLNLERKKLQRRKAGGREIIVAIISHLV
jgi:hypothetical protein